MSGIAPKQNAFKAKRNLTKRLAMVDKTLYRKPKIQQHELKLNIPSLTLTKQTGVKTKLNEAPYLGHECDTLP
jgi:hypothetical protein